jgi:hypothetical protein
MEIANESSIVANVVEYVGYWKPRHGIQQIAKKIQAGIAHDVPRARCNGFRHALLL